MSFPSLEEHAAAIKAHLTEADARPYDLDEVPALLPDAYTVLGVTRRYGTPDVLGRSVGTRSVRFWTRWVSRSVTNCRVLQERTMSIEDAVLAVGDYDTTPIKHESDVDIEKDDDGFYTGISFFTYVI